MKKILILSLFIFGCHKKQPEQNRSQSPSTASATKEIKIIVDALTDSTYISISPFDYPNATFLMMNNFSHTFITNQPERHQIYVLTAYDARANTLHPNDDTIRVRGYLDGILQFDAKQLGSTPTEVIIY